MSKILYGIAILIIIVLGVVFAVLHADYVTLNYYFGSIRVQLSLALVLSLLLGVILGILASIGLVLKYKKEVSRLRRASEIAEKEINNLRAIPIKNQH